MTTTRIAPAGFACLLARQIPGLTAPEPVEGLTARRSRPEATAVARLR